ncbi:zinc finger protein OZF-like [Chrysoperla carnea]|uniref:zinc finger protein OZF-like n=1 Tax=Chrysoperla carnea TaxID=189513 RepID=UPI001D06D00C|nr:zinc finger protein OZF-like [Chrysoperla carnea]
MDIKNLFCRLCAELQPDYNLLEISDDKATNMNLANKIMQCYNVKITKDDVLPRHVCSNCCDKVINAFEFHELVHKSQEFLMKQMIKVKQENIESSNSYNDDLNVNDFSDDFLNTTKQENNSDDSNSEDENSLIQNKSTLKDPQNSISKREYLSDRDVECVVKEIKTPKRKSKKWKCVDCDIYLANHMKFRDHCLNEHNREPEFPCPDCSKVYNKYDSYFAHIRSHKGKFVCEICNKVCRANSILQRHMKTHSSETPFPCMECNKSFKTEEYLQKHQNVHLPEGIKKKKPKVYSCDLCYKTFTKEENLIAHKENHGPEEPARNFVCDICGNNFTRKGNLKQHMTTHNNAVPLRCDKCPTVFKNERSLRRHQICHTNTMPYTCDVCLRPFRHKRGLKRHAEIHTNLLPHECEYCQKRFRQKSFLKIHIRQHTGERPYSCLECNHSFTNDSNFIKHLKGRHGLANVSVANQRQYPFVYKTDE